MKKDKSQEYAEIWVEALDETEDLLKHRPEDDALPVKQLLEIWVKSQSKLPSLPKPTLRTPASAQALTEAEKRLGVSIPSQLRELYKVSDGVDWKVPKAGVEGFGLVLPPLASLSVGSGLKKPISKALQTYWKEYGQEMGEDAHVSVFSTTPYALLADVKELVLEFKELDGFLVIQSKPSESFLVMNVGSTAKLPVGAILDIEGVSATHYLGLHHWLGATSRQNMRMCGRA